MPFDTALSGIRAASSELELTGNNIANASTTGFKSSRVEFGDVYATSVLGSGLNATGAGVQVQDISQRFTQGNVAFTENELDLAINGNGFFVVSQDGERAYTRAGSFGLDDEGFVVTNTSARLQGFPADGSGNIGGIVGDITIQTSNLAPRQTTLVESTLNLNSTLPVLQTTGRQFVTEGNVISETQLGQQQATTSALLGDTFTLPLANDFSAAAVQFDIDYFSPTAGASSVSIDLQDVTGVPPTVTTFNDLRTLASVINAQIFSPATGDPIDVTVEAVDLGGGNYQLQLSDLNDGVASTIAISSPVGDVAGIGLDTTTFTQGIAEVTNGYPAQSLDITAPDGEVIPYTSNVGATAAETASELNSIPGITATASTEATLSTLTFGGANTQVSINGFDFTVTGLNDLNSQINDLTNSSAFGISATYDAGTDTLLLSSQVGNDIRVELSGADGDTVSMQGGLGSPVQALVVDNTPGVEPEALVVGGQIELTLEEGYAIGNESPLGVGLFQPIGDSTDPDNPVFTDVVINAFDPSDQDTYNSATSMTIYDSLGNAHVMTQFFVKQPYDVNDPTSAPNHWVMYVQVDGQNVGDPDPSAPTVATQASYDVYFNEDGSLNNQLTNDILISNWTPLDASGNPNGALGPLNVLNGGNTLIPEPPTTSNFIIELPSTTQFGSEFSVNDVDQNGFTTGQLSGLNIDDSGVIFARFTNGESQILGQVVLADFTNQQGLQPIGNTMWAESFESGGPNIGVPGSATLGAIQAGALEESNVDLSEQLVALIIAQRNFQASAKTIETADQTTQTIINLR